MTPMTAGAPVPSVPPAGRVPPPLCGPEGHSLASTFSGVAHKRTWEPPACSPPKQGPPSRCSLMGDPSASATLRITRGFSFDIV
jgi:hypothetical protein